MKKQRIIPREEVAYVGTKTIDELYKIQENNELEESKLQLSSLLEELEGVGVDLYWLNEEIQDEKDLIKDIKETIKEYSTKERAQITYAHFVCGLREEEIPLRLQNVANYVGQLRDGINHFKKMLNTKKKNLAQLNQDKKELEKSIKALKQRIATTERNIETLEQMAEE